MKEKDPAEDKKEFKARLEQIFDWQSEVTTELLLEEMALNDGVVSAETKAKIQGCKDKIDGYLADWDSATGQKGRETVVSSVKR